MCSKSDCKSSQTNGNTLLTPSVINHIYSGASGILSEALGDSVMTIAQAVAAARKLPSLQVVKKDGHWFALNSAHLNLCIKLEQEGKFSKMKVDVVSLNQVPPVFREMMKVPETNANEQPRTSDSSRTTTKGYERVNQTENGDSSQLVEDSDEYTDSDSSVVLYSDSECEWSDFGTVSSDFDSSFSEDGSSSEDDEAESLL